MKVRDKGAAGFRAEGAVDPVGRNNCDDLYWLLGLLFDRRSGRGFYDLGGFLLFADSFRAWHYS
jgi:hypothetical protein